MDSTTRKLGPTVQGRETPVPVDVGGARTGPPRPLADDCSGGTVASQADLLETTTGKGKGGSSTQGKSFLESLGKRMQRIPSLQKIQTSANGPFSAPVSPVGNMAVLDLTWSDDEGRSLKRRKEEDGTNMDQEVIEGDKKMAVALRKIIKDIDKESRKMMQVIRENTNTKRELREIAGKMRSLTSQLMTTEAQEMLRRLGVKGSVHNVENLDAEVQTEETNLIYELEFLRDTNRKLILENTKLKEEIQNKRRKWSQTTR